MTCVARPSSGIRLRHTRSPCYTARNTTTPYFHTTHAKFTPRYTIPPYHTIPLCNPLHHPFTLSPTIIPYFTTQNSIKNPSQNAINILPYYTILPRKSQHHTFSLRSTIPPYCTIPPRIQLHHTFTLHNTTSEIYLLKRGSTMSIFGFFLLPLKKKRGKIITLIQEC